MARRSGKFRVRKKLTPTHPKASGSVTKNPGEQPNPDQYADNLVKALGFSDTHEDQVVNHTETPPSPEDKGPESNIESKTPPEKIEKPPEPKKPDEAIIARAKTVAETALKAYKRVGYSNPEKGTYKIIKENYDFDEETIREIVDSVTHEIEAKAQQEKEATESRVAKMIDADIGEIDKSDIRTAKLEATQREKQIKSKQEKLDKMSYVKDLSTQIDKYLSKLPADVRLPYLRLSNYGPKFAEQGLYPSLKKGGVYTIKKLGFLEKLRDRRKPQYIAADRLQDIVDELSAIYESQETTEEIAAIEEQTEEEFYEAGEKMTEAGERRADIENKKFSGTRLENGKEVPITWANLVSIAEELGKGDYPPTSFPELYQQLQDKEISISDKMVAAGAIEDLLDIIYEAAKFSAKQVRQHRVVARMQIQNNEPTANLRY